jgi:1,4-alpha-glucan branching enzyme
MATSSSAKRRTTFALEAPHAASVEVLGDFTGWEQAPLPLRKGKNGRWSLQVSLPPGRHEYRLRVDGQWQDDPACADRVDNGFGTQNCVRVVA